MAGINRSGLARRLPGLLDRAVTSQIPAAAAYVNRVRGRRPGATPGEVAARLGRTYLATVTGSGGAAGAAAAAPGVGTAAALGVNVAEVGWFLEATALYILALATVHEVAVTDPERRRTLMLTILVGNGAAGGVEKLAGKTGPHLARQIIGKIPMSSINKINKVLGPRFVTKFGTKQGTLVLGRELPFGLGAAIGAGGNAAVGYGIIRTARTVFGPPPDNWPEPARSNPTVPSGPADSRPGGAFAVARHDGEQPA